MLHVWPLILADRTAIKGRGRGERGGGKGDQSKIKEHEKENNFEIIMVVLLTQFSPSFAMVFYGVIAYFSFTSLCGLLPVLVLSSTIHWCPELLLNPNQRGGPSSIHVLPGQKRWIRLFVLHFCAPSWLTALSSSSYPHMRHCNSHTLLCISHQICLTKVFSTQGVAPCFL